MTIVILLQTTKGENFKDGIYLGWLLVQQLFYFCFPESLGGNEAPNSHPLYS